MQGVRGQPAAGDQDRADRGERGLAEGLVHAGIKGGGKLIITVLSPPNTRALVYGYGITIGERSDHSPSLVLEKEEQFSIASQEFPSSPPPSSCVPDLDHRRLREPSQHSVDLIKP